MTRIPKNASRSITGFDFRDVTTKGGAPGRAFETSTEVHELDSCWQSLVGAAGTIDGGDWAYAIPPKQVRKGRTTPRAGKWMIFSTCAQATSIWTAIAAGVSAGHLRQSKVSILVKTEKRGSHVICVYHNDYRDIHDLITPIGYLRGILPRGMPMQFMTDASTERRILYDEPAGVLLRWVSESTSIEVMPNGLEQLSDQAKTAFQTALAHALGRPSVNVRGRPCYQLPISSSNES